MIKSLSDLFQMLPKKFKSLRRQNSHILGDNTQTNERWKGDTFFCLNDQEALAKFEAVFLGSLIGVCLGKKFEGFWGPNLRSILESYKALKKQANEPNLNEISLCDLNPFSIGLDPSNGDMELSLALSDSLIQSGCIDMKSVAFFFRQRFNKDPEQDYATSNITICRQFNILLATGQFDENYMLPATQLFYGAGSYGSSAATRSFPIALFTYYKPLDEMLLACELETRLSHTHIWAIIGSKLQCYAIREAMKTGSSQDSYDFEAYFLRLVQFTVELEKSFAQSEDSFFQKFDGYSKSLQENLVSYVTQKEQMTFVESHKTNGYISSLLWKIYHMLVKCRKGQKVNFRDVFEAMGKKMVSSVQSICLGIICAIVACDGKCAHELNDKLTTEDATNEFSPIERTVFYAFTFSGESGTISMLAGAIVGAFCGKRTTPAYLYRMCDNHEEVRKMARDLFQVTNAII